MTHEPSDSTPSNPKQSPVPERDSAYARYGTFNTANGSVVIYDERNSQAWIQSDSAIDISARE